MNWKLTSLYPMALTLVHQLYQRYRFCDAGHPFWMFYRQWKDQRQHASLCGVRITLVTRRQEMSDKMTSKLRVCFSDFLSKRGDSSLASLSRHTCCLQSFILVVPLVPVVTLFACSVSIHFFRDYVFGFLAPRACLFLLCLATSPVRGKICFLDSMGVFLSVSPLNWPVPGFKVVVA